MTTPATCHELLTFALDTVRSQTLSSELLNGESHRVQDTSEIDVQHPHIGLLKTPVPILTATRSLGEPSLLADPGNGVDEVDAAKGLDGPRKSLDLGWPFHHINGATLNGVTLEAELVDDLLRHLQIIVGDEDTDAGE